jgi:hypothetical protein
MKIRQLLLFIALWTGYTNARAQQEQKPLEVFCGAELGYADTNLLRLYDVLVNLTPGAKWHMGNDWMFAVQASLPIICEGYSYQATKYHFMQLSKAVVSKQLHFSDYRQHFKLSAGLFGTERYGADIKWMMPVNDWLLLQAQAGLTSRWLIVCDMDGNYETSMERNWRPTYRAGANFWVKPINMEFRVSVGRYINKDYGMQIDAVSHFRYCTIDMFYQVRMGHRIDSDVDKYEDHTNGGFRIVYPIPPYKHHKKLYVGNTEIRPAKAFRLTNNVRSDGRSMYSYDTDPEENEREHQVDVDWGLRKEGTR